MKLPEILKSHISSSLSHRLILILRGVLVVTDIAGELPKQDFPRPTLPHSDLTQERPRVRLVITKEAVTSIGQGVLLIFYGNS